MINDSSPVCFAFRDTGTCKFGKTCRYPHVKGSSQPKFQHKANTAEVLEQYAANIEQEHALKLQEFKRKMDRKFDKKFEKKFSYFRKKDKMKPYKKKLDEQNSRFATKDKVNLAEEEVSEEKADVAKELEKEVDKDSDSQGSNLSNSESEEEDK